MTIRKAKESTYITMVKPTITYRSKTSKMNVGEKETQDMGKKFRERKERWSSKKKTYEELNIFNIPFVAVSGTNF